MSCNIKDEDYIGEAKTPVVVKEWDTEGFDHQDQMFLDWRLSIRNKTGSVPGPYRIAKHHGHFKEGDVVYNASHRKNGYDVCRIYRICTCDKSAMRGEFMIAFKVQRLLANGHWSKTFQYAYPGTLQQGYKNANIHQERMKCHDLLVST